MSHFSTALRTSAVFVGFPVAAVTAYLMAGFAAMLFINDPMMATITGGLVITLMALLLRGMRPQWLHFAPRPAPLGARGRFAALVVGALVLAFMTGQTSGTLLYQVLGSPGFDQHSHTLHSQGVLMMLMLGLIVAPVAEEVLFRGTLYPLLRRRLGIVASIIATGVSFALLHGNIVQIAASLPLAVLAAVVYERTRSLWLCIGLHVVFNAAAMVTPSWFIAGLTSPITVVLLGIGCGLVLPKVLKSPTGSWHSTRSTVEAD